MSSRPLRSTCSAGPAQPTCSAKACSQPRRRWSSSSRAPPGGGWRDRRRLRGVRRAGAGDCAGGGAGNGRPRRRDDGRDVDYGMVDPGPAPTCLRPGHRWRVVGVAGGQPLTVPASGDSPPPENAGILPVQGDRPHRRCGLRIASRRPRTCRRRIQRQTASADSGVSVAAVAIRAPGVVRAGVPRPEAIIRRTCPVVAAACVPLVGAVVVGEPLW